MANKPKLLTQVELAREFKKSRETIRLWAKAGMPSRRGGYVLADCIEWREAQIREEAKSGETPDEAKERARKMAADADISELKRDELRGALVQGDQVDRTWERTLGVLDSRMTAARGKWAPKLIGLASMAESTAVMDALISDLRAAFVDGADELEEGDEAEEAA